MRLVLDRPTRRARFAGLALLAAAGWGADAVQPIDIPVRKVVLFSSGVGYFEHAGKVDGLATTELRFKAAQINDILKSLVVEDRGGAIGQIAYPSFDPIAKTLQSFQVNIAGNPSLGDLLNQLRGARVKVTVGGDTLDGTILGLEKHVRQVGKDNADRIESWRMNLLSGAVVRTVELDDARSIELTDAQLQAELGKALAALSQARDQDKKPVTISFAGKGARDVALGYVVETPVWKTSYRLILPDVKDAAAKPALQGWAIVENQTDTDWNGVALTLVSGRPISFVQDLYQPLYVPRPTVEPELYASLRPQTYDAGRDAQKDATILQAERSRREDGRPTTIAGKALRLAAKGAFAASAAPATANAIADEEMGGEGGLMAVQSRPIDPTAGVASVANAQKVGEFFQYQVADVTLPRQRSAMLPIVTDAIEVERVSIYNQAVLAKNPLLGARVVNTTGKHLLQGPVTVLDTGSYAGDARIDDVPPGQERLLSFAIDLQVRVEAAGRRQDATLLTGKLSQGVLRLTRKLVTTQDYAIDNKGDSDRAIIVEHPLQPGWKLVDTPKPIETTETLYRFKDTVPAGKALKLVVKEERIQEEAQGIVDFDTPTLELYANTGEMPKAVRDAFAKAAAMRRAVDDVARQIDEKNRKVAEITNEQNRIRQNMQTVRQNSDYYNRLLAKLNDQETQLEALRGEVDKLTADREQKLQDLRAYLATLELG